MIVGGMEALDKKLFKDIAKAVVIAGLSSFITEMAKWGAETIKSRTKKGISKQDPAS